MRNRNKIVMIIVSILLCLTLISTSLVSSVFAKYTKTATGKLEQVSLKKFGVEVKITPDTASLEAAGATVEIEDGNTSYTVTISNLQMVPGDAFYDALKVEVTGNPNFEAKFRMTCQIGEEDGNGNNSYDTNYTLPGEATGLGDYATVFMPLAFTCRTKTKSRTDVCGAWHNREADYIEETIIRNTAKQLGAEYPYDNDDYYFEETRDYYDGENFFFEDTFAKGVLIDGEINEFYMGFNLPITKSRSIKKPDGTTASVNTDMAGTWISEHVTTGITIKYTFCIEQQ